MREIVAAEFISLDGVFGSPEQWNLPYFNAEMGAQVRSVMAAADAMLMGQATYQERAAYWPTQDPEGNQIAGYMNRVHKYVVSTTLDSVGWSNSSLVKGNVAEEIAALKEQPGQDISISGSGTLVRSLLHEGLVDELRLMVHPLVLGRGKRLFGEGDQQELELVESKTFSPGVVYLTYRPAGQ